MALFPQLEGRTLMITGAASGIGRELARLGAEGGARLVLLDLNEQGLRETAALADEVEAEVYTLVVDVSDLLAMRAAFASLPAAARNIDMLFANAGISRITDPLDFDVETSARIMSVNYFGTINAVSLVLPGMLERRRGHLIATSSLAGLRGLPGSACYGASKAAQIVFLEGLRVDLRGKGVRITTALPGFVDTPINTPLHQHYHLPFMIPASRAARKMMRAAIKKRSSVAFPLPSRILGFVSKLIPNAIFDLCMRMNPFKKRGLIPPVATSDVLEVSQHGEAFDVDQRFEAGRDAHG